eukprot:scaffold10986_cov21-Tisochrysis_lutea.AAC.1
MNVQKCATSGIQQNLRSLVFCCSDMPRSVPNYEPSSSVLDVQVHLSLGDKDEMVLMWRTHEEGCGSKVMYGRGEGPSHADSMVVEEGKVLTVQ